jgi:hypothetical protein
MRNDRSRVRSTTSRRAVSRMPSTVFTSPPPCGTGPPVRASPS